MKIEGLSIINPRNRKKSVYKGEFNATGMNTLIPKEILQELSLKPGDSVMFEYKGVKVTTSIGPNGRVGLTTPEVQKLGYLKD